MNLHVYNETIFSSFFIDVTPILNKMSYSHVTKICELEWSIVQMSSSSMA